MIIRRIVSAPELVEMYRGTAVKRSTIYALLKSGRLPSTRIGSGRYLINVDVAEQFFMGQSGSNEEREQQIMGSSAWKHLK